MERAGGVPRQLFSPEQIGEAIGRDAMPARRQEDLEHLLRAAAAEIPRAQLPGALDLERPEKPNQQTLSMLLLITHLQGPASGRVLSLCAHIRYRGCPRHAHRGYEADLCATLPATERPEAKAVAAAS